MAQEFPLRQSSVATFLECPRKARLEYIEGQRGPTYPRMATGTAAHAGADLYNRAIIAGRPAPSLDEVVAATRDKADRLIEDVDFSQEEDAASERVAMVERAVAFAAGYVEHVVPTLGTVTASERPFSVSIAVPKLNAPDALYELTGTIDCETTSAVRDLKTTTRAMSPPPRYLVQLGTYALASTHREDYFAEPDGVIDSLVMSETKRDGRRVRYLPTVIPAAALAEESALARETIVRVAQAAERGDYPRNPTACEQYNRPCAHLASCMPWRTSVVEAREAVIVTAPKAAKPRAAKAAVHAAAPKANARPSDEEGLALLAQMQASELADAERASRAHDEWINPENDGR